MSANEIFSKVVYHRGLCYMKLGDYPSARQDFNTILRMDNEFKGRALHKIGKVAMLEGDWWTSIEKYSAALAADPNYIAAYHDRGVAYEAIGQDDKAEMDRRNAQILRRKVMWGNATKPPKSSLEIPAQTPSIDTK